MRIVFSRPTTFLDIQTTVRRLVLDEVNNPKASPLARFLNCISAIPVAKTSALPCADNSLAVFGISVKDLGVVGRALDYFDESTPPSPLLRADTSTSYPRTAEELRPLCRRAWARTRLGPAAQDLSAASHVPDWIKWRLREDLLAMARRERAHGAGTPPKGGSPCVAHETMKHQPQQTQVVVREVSKREKSPSPPEEGHSEIHFRSNTSQNEEEQDQPQAKTESIDKDTVNEETVEQMALRALREHYA